MVSESERHVSLCPFASRFAFEMAVLPKWPQPHFDALADADLADLAGHLKAVLQRLEQAADDPPYNFVLRTAPFHAGEVESFSWRLEILPRIGRIAGYEWGTGWFINLVPPETAAERLRAAYQPEA
jgi:UDPglucose--hexose-1-phosphate uridylyltransferase